MSKQSVNVLVFSEQPHLTLELLAKGRQLADTLGGRLITPVAGQDSIARLYVEHGADRVLLLKNPEFQNLLPEAYGDALASLAQEYEPKIILIGATRFGLELAPRLAERLKTGCVTEAMRFDLDAEKEQLLMDRVVFGGNILETQVCKTEPHLATVPKGLFTPIPADPARNGEVVESQIKLNASNVKLLRSSQKTGGDIKLSEAKVIVSFGRGLRRREDIDLIKQLAEIMGAAVACSRPIAEDLGWLPRDQYVGLSGEKVNPKLYLACGISGQIQHLTGIRNSRIIVAINNDSAEPIFDSCDYGVVGDLYQVIPQLIEALRIMKRG